MKRTIGSVTGWAAILAGVIGLLLVAFGLDPQAMISGGAGIVLAVAGFFLKAQTTRMNITAIGLSIAAILFASITY
ncbi:hypothetical protein [Alkalibacterium thalassium]|uniref:Uncharacterized protein n=1 Tax=Alkalibacterium thalassium TaxID=426701 RepID=A0A1G8YFT2_9LACT|nr:hypothetical protein [Alkalibacterium thalassium]SDK01095.1 hypothetical protein SAMN04488098_100956 [Alkalibacterium thalassium]